MQDLFDNELGVPMMRPASSTRLGARTPGTQSPLPTPPSPAAEANLDENGEPIPLPLRNAVEQRLQASHLAYVDVANGQKGLFRKESLRPFDFVAYGPDQPTWLILANDTSDAARRDLLEWERILGPGFLGLVAIREYDEDPVLFVTLDGERVKLD